MMAAQNILDSARIVDTDSHVIEPVDLWTSRFPRGLMEEAPHVEWDEAGQEHRWRVGGVWLAGVGEYCSAGWREPFPSHPPTLEEADPSCWNASERAKKLDSWGVSSQLLYPNIIAFDTHVFMTELSPEAALVCVQAYNDFLVDFANEAPGRFVPIMMLPIWDVEKSVAEMHRAKALGHKGVVFAALLDQIGLPHVASGHWDPIFHTAQDLDLSLNFHLAVATRKRDDLERGWNLRTKAALSRRTNRLSFIKKTGLAFVSSIEATSEMILQGICERFPRLRFVSVESGFGYWPYVLEQMDWLWASSGTSKEYPDRMLPSEYWRRQFYVTFWHEHDTLTQLPNYADNVMFETDFPHETSLASQGFGAREVARKNLQGLDDDVIEKVLYKTASKLYGLE